MQLKSGLITVLAGVFAASAAAIDFREDLPGGGIVYPPPTEYGPVAECVPRMTPSPDLYIAEAGDKLSDPISLATGDFQIIHNDLFLRGRSFDFQLSRMYRSRSGYWSTSYHRELVEGQASPLTSGTVLEQPLGMNWDHNYNIVVEYDATDDVIVYRGGTGRRDIFTNDNGVSTDPGVKAYSRSGSYSVFMYTASTGVVEEFDAQGGAREYWSFTAPSPANPDWAPGRIKSIMDRNGNTMLFDYEKPTNAPYRLKTVTDTLGKEITFTYHDASGSPFVSASNAQPQLLWKVADEFGREVEYHYELIQWNTSDVNRKPKLVEVRLPEIKDDLTNGFALDSAHARFEDTLSADDRRRWRFECIDQDVTGNDEDEFEAASVPDSPSVALASDGSNFWWGGQIERVISPNG